MSRLHRLLGAFFVILSVISCAMCQSASSASKESLLWGPYRPNLYFGVRPRIPNSLMTGLLWARADDPQHIQHNFRYTCEQSDKMDGYGWEQYDARKGGHQVIHDTGNMVDITTDFVKVPGGQHGGNWGARISGKLQAGAPSDLKTTVIFTASMQGLGSLNLTNKLDPTGYEGDVRFQGYTSELGAFTLDITNGPETNTHPFVEHPSAQEKSLDKTLVDVVQVPPEELWQTKGIVFRVLKDQIDSYLETYGQENLPPTWQLFTIPNRPTAPANANIVQKVFEGAFEFDVLFSSSSAPEPMTSEKLTPAIASTAKDFETKYAKLLKASSPFDKTQYELFSKSLLSNLMGGIGYFHGESVVDKSYAPEYEEENDGFWTEAEEARARNKPTADGPHELFSAVPSRPFFPRGFMWDEGFHLLPIVDWDTDLVVDILTSWFNLMDQDGWIAREQILGLEARSKVPAEYQTQYPHYANPPTLFLVFESLLNKMDSKGMLDDQKEHFTSTLKTLYPLLRRHYFWYRKTQKGDLKSYDRNPSSAKEAYRWKGRTLTHLLTSGLDDYPRAQPPHPGELHVDLISWMGMMTRILKRIAEIVGEIDDISELSGYETAIARNIDDLHWSEESQAFCDATVNDFEESVHVCHIGYIALLPFLTGMLKPDSPRLSAILDRLSSPDELWSAHGIRSLSQKDEFYDTGENYWRSPVWMNINYLVLTSLLNLAQDKSSPYQKRASGIYTELRHNLVETVYKSWKETGFAWEQYNPVTGAGQRTAHFTGWTSLVVTIMRMPDLGGAAKGAVPVHGEL